MAHSVKKDYFLSCISNKNNEGCTVTIPINKTIRTDGSSLWATGVVKDVLVENVTLWMPLEDEDDEDDEDDEGVMYGDFGICYDMTTWDDETDGLIYTDDSFLQQVKDCLIAAGFDAVRVNSIDYTEQGMQAEGRISVESSVFFEHLHELLVEFEVIA